MANAFIANPQVVDPVGSMARGSALGQSMAQVSRMNALRDAIGQNGAGSPQAMSAFGQADPAGAMNALSQQRQQAAGLAAERRQQLGAALGTIADLPPEQFGAAYARLYEIAGREGAQLDGVPRPGEATPEQARMMSGYLTGEVQAGADERPRRYRVGDQLVDADGNVIFSGTAPQGFRPATTDEAAGYGAAAGQFGPDGRFYPINPPSGMSIESDGQGGFRLTQGPGVQAKPFTEGQSKDNVYTVRARGALEDLNTKTKIGDPLVNSLASVGDRILDSDPTGVLRGEFQSPEYQVAWAAGQEFLSAILRKDTGAAITQQEQDIYGAVYLPRPGDGPEVLAQKEKARERAISAMEAGMSPAQMLAVERGLSDGDAATEGAELPDQPPTGVTPEQWEIIRSDPDLSKAFGGSGAGNPSDPASQVPGPASQIIRSGQPAAPIQLARAFVGKNEKRDAPILSAFFRKMTGDRIDPAQTPWCAAFANAVLAASGESGTGRLNARSFLEWGEATERPTQGDVVVLWRESPDSWKGHVGFFAGYDGEGGVRVVGGNQDNSVSEKTYSADNILGFRRPPRLNGVQA